MQLAIRMKGDAVTGFEATCPALPGCRVFAQSREMAWQRIHDAVQGYLASLDVALPRELGRMLESGSLAKAG